MVHLSAINKDDSGSAASIANDAVAHLTQKARSTLKLSSEEDSLTTSVYGSRFAEQELPRFTMPERAMPREIAYRMIKDDLSLDNNPKLKYVCIYQSA